MSNYEINFRMSNGYRFYIKWMSKFDQSVLVNSIAGVKNHRQIFIFGKIVDWLKLRIGSVTFKIISVCDGRFKIISVCDGRLSATVLLVCESIARLTFP